ncbi:hypothetical protein [Azorhizophilus paspali]|uniref:Uncharacterized protein n=1 Tax=Azorhizophilus paspali TaxID=69963 RepID=A0ABV6SLD4_AZOPA
MPGTDGLQATQLIRQHKSVSPMHSSRAKSPDRNIHANGLEAGPSTASAVQKMDLNGVDVYRDVTRNKKGRRTMTSTLLAIIHGYQ